MSFIDKAKHRAEVVVGEVKEKVGELTGNDRLKAEGQKDRVSGNVTQTGDSVKDAASNLGDKLKGDKH
jgi:uncharacterized protein YjbJ (UPF0337 family)